MKDFITILFIAFGLSMDAFAVSISGGATIKELKIKHALRIALFFGGFQAIMPLVGFLAGSTITGFISAVDHWIVFGILSFIGGKMIYESIKLEKNRKRVDYRQVSVLLILAITTSIDALAVGFGFAFLKLSIITPLIIIGAVTFIVSMIGVLIGKVFGYLFENKIEIIGGLLLIGIAIKILIEHLRA